MYKGIAYSSNDIGVGTWINDYITLEFDGNQEDALKFYNKIGKKHGLFFKIEGVFPEYFGVNSDKILLCEFVLARRYVEFNAYKPGTFEKFDSSTTEAKLIILSSTPWKIFNINRDLTDDEHSFLLNDEMLAENVGRSFKELSDFFNFKKISEFKHLRSDRKINDFNFTPVFIEDYYYGFQSSDSVFLACGALINFDVKVSKMSEKDARSFLSSLTTECSLTIKSNHIQGSLVYNAIEKLYIDKIKSIEPKILNFPNYPREIITQSKKDIKKWLKYNHLMKEWELEEIAEKYNIDRSVFNEIERIELFDRDRINIGSFEDALLLDSVILKIVELNPILKLVFNNELFKEKLLATILSHDF